MFNLTSKATGYDFKDAKNLTEDKQTLVLGVFTFCGAISSFFTISHFNRRTVFITGHFMMAFGLIMAYISLDFIKNELAFLFSLCIYVVSFQGSTGTGFYVYGPEIATSAVMGLCIGFQMLILANLQFFARRVVNAEFGVESAMLVFGSI